MGPIKASGSDGFHAAFFQKSWDVMRKSVVSFVQDVLVEEMF